MEQQFSLSRFWFQRTPVNWRAVSFQSQSEG